MPDTTVDHGLIEYLAPRRVLFVGGKGGVGKTSISSAIALSRAREGAKVLLVSTDPAHNLGHLWGVSIGDDTTRLVTDEESGGHLDAVEIDPQRTVDRHLAAVGDTMRRLLPERMQRHAKRHLELAREAPGSHEAAILERVADMVELGLLAYDLLVFDTAPSGHTLRLMALPSQLGTWTETLLANRDRSDRFAAALQGLTQARDEDPQRSEDALLRQVLLRRRHRFELLQRTVTDAEGTGFLVVCLAEPMPVAESIEIAASLRRLEIPLLGFIVNRRSPEGAGELLAQRRIAEEMHLAVLREAMPDIPLFEVPLLGSATSGADAASAVAAALP